MRSICDNEIVAAPLKCLLVLPLVLDSRHFPIFLYIYTTNATLVYLYIATEWHYSLLYMEWKICSVAQPRNYNRQSLASLCTQNYIHIHLVVDKYIPIHFVHVHMFKSSIENVAKERKIVALAVIKPHSGI